LRHDRGEQAAASSISESTENRTRLAPSPPQVGFERLSSLRQLAHRQHFIRPQRLDTGEGNRNNGDGLAQRSEDF
jgi:hypothetical protein